MVTFGGEITRVRFVTDSGVKDIGRFGGDGALLTSFLFYNMEMPRQSCN